MEAVLVGDGHDLEPLLTYKQVARILGMKPDEVYRLPIPRIRISERRTRWRPADVRAYLSRRTDDD